MKALLASLLLCLCLRAHAQGPETRPSSQRYGWFQPEQWVRAQQLGSPGWRLQSRDTGPDGWQYDLYATEHSEKGITYKFWRGGLGGIAYLFYFDNPEGREWRTAQFERMSENEWVDKPNNAIIRREYDGHLIVYNVIFEPFTKD